MTLNLNQQGMPVWHGAEVKLPPKERAVLALLIKRHPDTLGKDEIIKNVWPDDASVSDDSLVRCISQIRKALPAIRIESIYGYGYRLLAGNAPPAQTRAEIANVPVAAVGSYLHATTLAQEFTGPALKQSASLFRSLIDQYPNYMPARLGIAYVLAWSITHKPDKKIASLCAEAWFHIDIVSKVSPHIHGLMQMKGLLCDVTWQFDWAERCFHEARCKEPEDSRLIFLYAWHLITVGRGHECIDLLYKAMGQRACDLPTHVILAYALACVERYEEAIHQIHLAEQKYSADNPLIAGAKVMILASFCPTPALIDSVKKLGNVHSLPLFSRASLPYVLARCGKIEEAREEIQRVKNGQHSISENILLVKALVALNELDLAAQMIEEAYKARYSWLPFLLRFPAYAPLRNHPTLKTIYLNIYSSI